MSKRLTHNLRHMLILSLPLLRISNAEASSEHFPNSLKRHAFAFRIANNDEQPPEETDPEQAGFGSRGGMDLALLRFFFAVIREHTVEGYFCDPIYGGNRGAVGWRLVGFPGAQWGYMAEQMKPGFDASVIPIKTLSDLRRELKNLPDNKRYYASEET